MRTRWVLWATLAMILLLGLAGCGGSDKGNPAPTPTAISAEGSPAQNPAKATTYVTLGVQAAYEQLGASEGAQFVDVREANEAAATGLPAGASLIPLGQFEQRAPKELAKDRPVYVICNSGNRSRVAAEALIRLGYSQVYNVDGGIQAWRRAGLPVEPYKP